MHLSLSLEVRPAEWELRVRNEGNEPVRLTFPTAQFGDVVLGQDGIERWRWSAGKLFAQVISERELAPAEVWSFSLAGVPDVEPGQYEATASVRARPAPPPVRKTVDIEAS